MIIVPERKIILPQRIGLKGFLRTQLINKFSGKITYDSGFFPNTLLTNGLNELANRNFVTHCHVGTDGTAPNATQTSLIAYVATHDSIVGTESGSGGSDPNYYGYKRWTFRFNAGGGIANENLAEVGVGWDAVHTDNLISRSKLKDPVTKLDTTVTPQADELLQVTYELRYYSPTVEVTSPQVTLAGITYDTITKAANVTGGAWHTDIGIKIGVKANTSYWKAYDGNIGTTLTEPSGNSSNCDTGNQYNSAYSNQSYQLQINCPVGPDGWNLGSGIRSILFRTTAGEYQTQFSANPGGATIPKTSSYTMLMSWIISWSAV